MSAVPNPVLAEIYQTGVMLSTGETHSADENGMPRTEGQRLYDLVRQERPQTSLEVGLAWGLSALWMCQAIADNGGGRHVVMDPYQTSYDSAGLRHLDRAGLRHLVEFHPESSHRALPKLEAQGTHIDFAFIDGLHTFDFTMVEFFYIDLMLKVGGLIVFDDLWLPAVRKVVRYALTNRNYKDESGLANITTTWRKRAGAAKRSLKAVRGSLASAFGAQDIVVQEVHGLVYPDNIAVIRKVDEHRNPDWQAHVEF